LSGKLQDKFGNSIEAGDAIFTKILAGSLSAEIVFRVESILNCDVAGVGSMIKYP
jgi:hypothetical protein